MKKFFKKFILFCGIITAISFTTNLTAPSSASAFSCRYILGMTSWDCNVTDMHSETELTNNIVTIASNILTDISVIASYLVIGYVMWGGYLYMFSAGDPGKAANGKKTLIHAFIGLAITISAYTIFSAIRVALIGNKSLGSCDALATTTSCTTPDVMIVNLIQWVAGISGVVAAVFIVIGGWGYITSSGDPAKLQKAKSTLLYAFIGLIIVALTEVITAFVSSTVRDANAFVPTTVIAKDLNKETKNEIN